MSDQRRICANCENWERFGGVMECQNRDSDNMYRHTLPDDGCPFFERKEEQEYDGKR
jgi:hypothetical protein